MIDFTASLPGVTNSIRWSMVESRGCFHFETRKENSHRSKSCSCSWSMMPPVITRRSSHDPHSRNCDPPTAYASRVLWIAFVAIWILLAALAPIGFRQEYTTDFRSQDFYNGTRLKAMLAQGTVDESLVDQPLGRIASALPEELSRQLRRVGEGDEVRIFYRVFADALNACLDDESWYSKEAWSDTLQFRELRELDALEGPLEESIRRRRARLRIEAALPGVFEARSSQSIRLRYAGNDFPAGLQRISRSFSHWSINMCCR